MAFYEIEFPQNIAYGSSGGVGWLTRVVSTQAGYEYRNQQFSRPRGEWNAAHGIKQTSDMQALIAFHMTVQGKTHGFRFRDWNDYTDWGVGIYSVNSAGHLQLSKVYTSIAPVTGSTHAVFTRFISKPVPGTLTLTGGASVDYTTGLLTGGTAGQTWTGSFDVPCRFDVDKIDVTIEQPVGSSTTAVASSWKAIPIVELMLSPGASVG